jgi:small-conductance mechanosensitive channel
MLSKRKLMFKGSILGIIAVILIQIIAFAPIVGAASDYVNILDIDENEEYSKVVKAGETTTFNWTLENMDSHDRTLFVNITFSKSSKKWSASVVPSENITLPQKGAVQYVQLTVNAPNNNEGYVDVTLIFTVEADGAPISWETRNATTSLTAPEPEKTRVMDLFDNPLPEPLDKEWGVFLLTIVMWFVISIIIIIILDPFVKAFTKKTKTEVDDIILRIIRTPLLVLVFFFGVVDSLRILEEHIPEVILDTINAFYGVIAVLIIFYVAYKLFKDILVYYGELLAEKTSSNIDNVIIPIVEKLGVMIIGLLALGYVLGYMNIDLTMFVAGGVVISMVIAFAAQETLSNFFSGIFILTDRPFHEEDTIILPDGDWYEVRDIGLRSTRLFRFKDSCLITIPNNKLANEKIINYSNPYDKCRIRKTVGVAYGTDVEKTKKILKEVIYANEHVVTDKEGLEPTIRFNDLGDSSIDFFIQVIVDDRSNKMGVLDYLNTEIYRRFNEEGIEIPYPQRVVHMKKDEG